MRRQWPKLIAIASILGAVAIMSQVYMCAASDDIRGVALQYLLDDYFLSRDTATQETRFVASLSRESDPSDQVLDRLTAIHANIVPLSVWRAEGNEFGMSQFVAPDQLKEADLHIILDDITWQTPWRVQAKASYYLAPTFAGGYRYFMSRSGGEWQVDSAQGDWMLTSIQN